MYTNTESTIFQFIQTNNGVSAKEIIAHIHQNPTGIFRHLKKLQKEQLIYKIGKPPKVRYYAYTKSVDNPFPVLTNVINWATSGASRWIMNDEICSTRDVFQVRTDRLLHDLKQKIKNESLTYLLVAAVGEIGNNAFDHNLGHWLDIPGVYFSFDYANRIIALADRGQGILATIKRVKPEVNTHEEALRVALTEAVSGRAPEKRGNGLKFVKKVIEENNLHLILMSGTAVADCTAAHLNIHKSDPVILGVLASIHF